MGQNEIIAHGPDTVQIKTTAYVKIQDLQCEL